MCEDKEVTGCCRTYSRPEEQCDRYPACNDCIHLIADDGSTLEETSQHVEVPLSPTGFDSGPRAEVVREPHY